jgi:hypothetical protein
MQHGRLLWRRCSYIGLWNLRGCNWASRRSATVIRRGALREEARLDAPGAVGVASMWGGWLRERVVEEEWLTTTGWAGSALDGVSAIEVVASGAAEAGGVMLASALPIGAMRSIKRYAGAGELGTSAPVRSHEHSRNVSRWNWGFSLMPLRTRSTLRERPVFELPLFYGCSGPRASKRRSSFPARGAPWPSCALTFFLCELAS